MNRIGLRSTMEFSRLAYTRAGNGGVFKRGRREPLMLYCSSHRTLATEEIPLYLEAGIRIAPLLVDMWTRTVDRGLVDQLCDDWQASVDVPLEVLEQLQTANFFGPSEDPDSPAVSRFGGLTPEQMQLLDEHVDAIYVTVYPVAAAALLRWFKGVVIFRAFGHGLLNSYSKILRYYGELVAPFGYHANYVWCPLMSSLRWAEEPAVASNEIMLGHFVSSSRLQARWTGAASQPYVVETIPRITKQAHYRGVYRQYVRSFGSLPLKIVGDNPRDGGPAIQDERIMGSLSDREYHEAICAGRLSIYQGESPFHLHYHPIEFMRMGVPVLFRNTSGFAHEASAVGIGSLENLGMYTEPAQAVVLAKKLLADAALAVELSERQRVFSERVFSRARALAGAKMLRSAIATRGQKKFQARIARTLSNTLHSYGCPLSDVLQKSGIRLANHIRYRYGTQLPNHIRYRYGHWLSRKLP